MNPLDVDHAIERIRSETGASHVELTLTMPDWQTVTHTSGDMPDASGDSDVSTVLRVLSADNPRSTSRETD